MGGLTTLVNFGLFVLLHDLLGVSSTVSNLISISSSILFAYIANKLVVFKRRSENATKMLAEFAAFVGSRLFTMALEMGIVYLFDGVLGWNATLGKAVSQVVVVVSNYAISKLIVFRK